MPVKVALTKKSKTAVQDSKLAAASVLVNQYVAIEQALSLLDTQRAPLLKQAEELKSELRRVADEVQPDPAKTVELAGTKGVVRLGAHANQRTLTDPEQAVEMLKAAVGENVWSLVKITLGVLDDYLTPEQRAQIISEARTGPRSMKVEGL